MLEPIVFVNRVSTVCKIMRSDSPWYYFIFINVLQYFSYYVFTGETPDETEVKDGPIPWCRRHQLTFLAEQVSHHPPSKLSF